MIRLQDLTVQAGTFRLEQISLEIPTGRYGVLMGRTGSGKTTILECVCGLKPVVSGSVWLADRDVTRLKPAQRNLGYVPQDGALFSTLTVREHLAFALSIRGVDEPVIRNRVAELGDLLEITHLLDRGTKRLSGGEKQRVALGRALSFHPATLCLDEPLSALDDTTREQMCQLLIQVRERTGVTTLHITHNLDEAARLADCFFRLEGGRILPQPPPTRRY